MKIDQTIHKLLEQKFGKLESFSCIKKGVMTFKYEFSIKANKYIIRCYPKGREYLASIEYKYLQYFEQNNIKAPIAYDFSENYPAYMIYEKLEGEDLSEVFNRYSQEQQKKICQEVILNYNKISSLQTAGNGVIKYYNTFSHNSWISFIHHELENSFSFLNTIETNFDKCTLQEYMFSFLSNKIEECKKLVWSDFSLDNIIVTKDANLSGFIDFEGLIGGDPLLGVGYLQARNGNSIFYETVYQLNKLERYKDIIDFYSILRYLRLIIYTKTNLPNGSQRTPINVFLENSILLIKEKCNNL